VVAVIIPTIAVHVGYKQKPTQENLSTYPYNQVKLYVLTFSNNGQLQWMEESKYYTTTIQIRVVLYT